MGRPRGHAASLLLLLPWRRLLTVARHPSSGVINSKRRRRSGGTPKNSSSTPAESSPIPRTDPSFLPNNSEILVLFETPSGFAIFSMKEHYLNQPNIWAIFGEEFRAREIIWPKEFRIFRDKSSAINHGTGVSRELTEMILRHHHPRQKLAVAKPEYKGIIQTSLPGVPCVFDQAVMEVMWGLKNLMHSLVPQEELKLTREERLMPMSIGLKMFLGRHGFNGVKPEMVNEEVVIAACILLDAEMIVRRHSKQLDWAAGKLKDVSGISCEGWGTMKIATALKFMFDPFETTNQDMEIFTEKEVWKLELESHKYEDIISKNVSVKIFSELVEMREVKKYALEVLGCSLS